MRSALVFERLSTLSFGIKRTGRNTPNVAGQHTFPDKTISGSLLSFNLWAIWSSKFSNQSGKVSPESLRFSFRSRLSRKISQLDKNAVPSSHTINP
jgi:hypothetical protein